MTTAFCITTDAAYFLPALCAARSIRQQKDGSDLDIFIICGAGETSAGLHLRDGITLISVDLDNFSQGAPTAGFAPAVYGRLFLDRMLPSAVTRIVSLDADILVGAEGLAALRDVDLRGLPLAAACDMIFLKQFGGGALAQDFARHRTRLGLGADTPYFNNGMTVMDRQAWTAAGIGDAALRYVLDHPAACCYLEQDGLNATLKGRFAPLSPRYNFMGDFFALDLEETFKPIVRHFVTRPKPWEISPWNGRHDIPAIYRNFFDELGSRPPIGDFPALPMQTDVDWLLFRKQLLDWIQVQDFTDGWKISEPS
jgi:lipopolysaccharide biosynthesis glycosyltransferase